MPFIVTPRTVVDIDTSKVNPKKDRLLCSLKMYDESDLQVTLFISRPSYRLRPVTWFVCGVPSIISQDEWIIRQTTIRYMTDALDPQDGMSQERLEKLAAIEAGGGTIAIRVRKRPQIGEELEVHASYHTCLCDADDDRDWSFSRRCTAFELGTITAITPFTVE